MVQNKSAPPGDVLPRLVYEEASLAADWLVKAFGFGHGLKWGEGSSLTIQLSVGRGSLLIIGPRTGHGDAADLEFKPPRPGELHHDLLIRVDDLDDHHRRAVANGAEILLAPRTYPFGERQYSAQDPAGHLWTFTQSVADVEPTTWGARVPDTRDD